MAVDLSAELRYYEIRFTKMINNFFQVYSLDKLVPFVELMADISGANVVQIKSAMQKVLINDSAARINKDEYIITLKLYSDLNNTQIRNLLGCSPNTVVKALRDYEEEEIFIQPKFSALESGQIKIMMKSLHDISKIY